MTSVASSVDRSERLAVPARVPKNMQDLTLS